MGRDPSPPRGEGVVVACVICQREEEGGGGGDRGATTALACRHRFCLPCIRDHIHQWMGRLGGGAAAAAAPALCPLCRRPLHEVGTAQWARSAHPDAPVERHFDATGAEICLPVLLPPPDHEETDETMID